MEVAMKLNEYVNGAIKNMLGTAGMFYGNDRKGKSFVLKMVYQARKTKKIRERKEKEGLHIPPFLIASIASSCNLHCAGCYARANGGCDSENAFIGSPKRRMQVQDWGRLFDEAKELGIAFILLVGGEPLLRRDILDEAADRPEIIFPVFTNGTMLNKGYLNFFDAHRNLIPVISLEGEDADTDLRRGEGVAALIWEAVDMLRERKLLFGISITATSKNKDTVVSDPFIEKLRQKGCGLVFYVEYVPAEEGTEDLILSESDQTKLRERVRFLREDGRSKGMILLDFPGDEKEVGGCLAAGRGFFHINSNGGAEPCPFSPYSEMNLMDHSLEEVLRSSFFQKVREISMGDDEELLGGCALFRRRKEIEKIAKGSE
jgi:MoaA/NifB/PqqE/SkfB family radical SAM enzyme